MQNTIYLMGFFIEGRYNFGLLNMRNIDLDFVYIPSGGVTVEGDYKNRFIQLGIGYKFK